MSIKSNIQEIKIKQQQLKEYESDLSIIKNKIIKADKNYYIILEAYEYYKKHEKFKYIELSKPYMIEQVYNQAIIECKAVRVEFELQRKEVTNLYLDINNLIKQLEHKKNRS